MALHPIAQAILDAYRALPPPEELDVDAARARSRDLVRRAPRGPDVAAVEERIAQCAQADLPVRIYRPDHAPTPGRAGAPPRPVVVYFHGGGFVLGDLDAGDAHCRQFCAGADCVVVSVNYRHAPEFKFPAAAEDAYAAVAWVADNVGSLSGSGSKQEATPLAVAGASAGATLATVAALIARERGGPRIVHQLLLVPGTDMEHDYPSYRDNAEGYGLTRKTMRWFGQQYFRAPSDRLHPYASPLRAADLTGLPPATILTAEYDPMRDEGEAYARALSAAGVRVRHKCYAGFIHLRLGPEADADMVRALRTAFAA